MEGADFQNVGAVGEVMEQLRAGGCKNQVMKRVSDRNRKRESR